MTASTVEPKDTGPAELRPALDGLFDGQQSMCGTSASCHDRTIERAVKVLERLLTPRPRERGHGTPNDARWYFGIVAQIRCRN